LATLVAQLVGIGAMLATRATPTVYLGGVVLGLLLAGIVGIVAGGVRSPRPAGMALTKRSLATALPTVPHSLALFGLFAVDRVMVERYEGLSGAGRYQLAYLVGAAGLSLLAAVNNAWSPIILGAPADRRWPALADTARTLTQLAVPVVLGIALAAPALLALAAPATYDVAALTDVTVLVAASLFPYLWYLSNVHVVFFHRRTLLLAVITPTAMLANVILNVWLVPAYGLEGAAVATVLGYTVLAVLVFLVASRLERVPWRWRQTVLAWGIGAVGLSVVGGLSHAGAAWIVARLVAVAGCVAAVLVLGRRAVVAERSLEEAEEDEPAGSPR
jgi:O-antigen/teichoic acid export membrane protein